MLSFSCTKLHHFISASDVMFLVSRLHLINTIGSCGLDAVALRKISLPDSVIPNSLRISFLISYVKFGKKKQIDYIIVKAFAGMKQEFGF